MNQLPPGFQLDPPPQQSAVPPGFQLDPVEPPQTQQQRQGANLGERFSAITNQIISDVGEYVPFLRGADALPRSLNLSDELTGRVAQGAVAARNLIRGEDADLTSARQAAEGQERQQVADYRQQFPVQSFAEEMASQAGAALLTGGTSLGQQAARFGASRPMIAGGLAGGVEGAISGAGAGTDARSRLRQAMQGAAIGAPLGAVTAGAADGLARRAGAGRAPLPEIDDLQAAKRSAYEAVDNMGARYRAESVDGLIGGMRARARSMNLNPTRHPAAASMLDSLDDIAAGRNMSLTELDQLRQVIRRDVANSTDRAEQEFGRMMIDELDDFINTASAEDMISGAAGDASAAIRAAREANSRFRKSELIDEAIDRARLRASSTGSGGNEENAIRQNLRRLVEPGSRYRNYFTQAEQDAIRRAVEGDSLQNVLRLASNFAPSRGGLSAMLGVGGSVAFPAVAVPGMLVGEAAKVGASARRQALLDAMERLVRTGQSSGRVPVGPAPALTGALMGGSGAARVTAEEERRRMSGPR